jgi:c-di-AMP phosphodiesterase-like protein
MPDADCIGSMVGVLKMALSSGKDASIVLDFNHLDQISERIITLIKESDSNLFDHIISIEDVDIKANTLLVICDTQSPTIMCYKELYDNIPRRCVIDHHRSGEIGFENTIFSYIESYASSAVELVSEMFSFYNKDTQFTDLEASIMLAGMVIDTNNFTYKMTREAFFYCYYLSTKGADVYEAQLYLKQDLKEYINRAKIIASTEIKGEIAIATGKQGRIYKSSDIAKTADLLLDFKGIKTSFAIGYLDKAKVGISARSVGKINAGKLMETFGGGGNKTEAAAVIENKTLKKVYEELKEKIK